MVYVIFFVFDGSFPKIIVYGLVTYFLLFAKFFLRHMTSSKCFYMSRDIFKDLTQVDGYQVLPLVLPRHTNSI